MNILEPHSSYNFHVHYKFDGGDGMLNNTHQVSKQKTYLEMKLD